jgi:MFS family permease
MSTFNIVSSFWGFLVGHAADRLGHKKLIIVSACLLSFHATLRYVGGFPAFLFASAVMGVSTASNKVVFEDWLMTELQSPDAPELSMVTIQENSALIRLLLTLAMTPVSAKLTREFGSSAAFSVSALLFFTSALIISIWMGDRKPSESRHRKAGYVESLKTVVAEVLASRELLIMLAIDVCYNVFYLLYSPRWLTLHQLDKKEKLPLSQMSSTASVALMNGAQIFGALLQVMAPKPASASRIVLCAGFLSYVAALVAILIVFENKNLVYAAYVLAAICDGGLEPVLRMSRSAIYPRDVRGYILGLLRVPNSLIVSGILLFVKNRPVTVIVSICIGFLSVATVLAGMLARKKPEKSQE